MNKRPFLKYIIAVIAMVGAWQFVLKPILRQVKGFDEVEWRGEKFKLKTKYLDYEEYKSDTDPIAPGEIDRLKKFMMSIAVPRTASSQQELRQGLRQMRFPGFGSTGGGEVKDEHGSRYLVFEYEIPQKQEQRTLLYRLKTNGTCELVIDGVSIDHENDHLIDGTR